MNEVSVINKEDDKNKNTSLKITLPEHLVNDLEIYIKENDLTKSDIVRNLLTNFFSFDQKWLNRIYVFKKMHNDTQKIRDDLQLSSKNTLIKIVANQENMPSDAYFLLCNLIRYDNNYVYVEIRPSYQPNPIFDLSTNDVSMSHEKLSLPDIKVISEPLPPTPELPPPSKFTAFPRINNKFIYKIEMDYVWAVYNQIENQWLK